MTPGTPKNPAIKDVTTFIPIETPKESPTKFTRMSKITPRTPLTISFHNTLSGHLSTFTIR